LYIPVVGGVQVVVNVPFMSLVTVAMFWVFDLVGLMLLVGLKE
jgi:hypothetical protein